MLDIQVQVSGDRVVIEGIQGLSKEMPGTIGRGLSRIIRGSHAESFKWLSGPGRTPMKSGSRLRGQSDNLGAKPGGYPIPVITGDLRRLLDFLEPGQSKGNFSAGPMEAVLYDSALYGSVIRDGTGSSAGYGKRDYLMDGFNRFNQGDQVAKIIEEEIQAEIAKRGLA